MFSFFAYIGIGKWIEGKTIELLAPNDNGLMIGPKEIEVTSEGIREVHEFGYSFYDWKAVENVEEVNGSIYVFVDRVLALIFNKESFTTDEEKGELLAILRKYA